MVVRRLHSCRPGYSVVKRDDDWGIETIVGKFVPECELSSPVAAEVAALRASVLRMTSDMSDQPIGIDPLTSALPSAHIKVSNFN